MNGFVVFAVIVALGLAYVNRDKISALISRFKK